MTALATNVLYCGDNVDIGRRYLPDASVDLIYLDPPFNSNRDYNLIFKDESGKPTDAQLLAFSEVGRRPPVPRSARIGGESVSAGGARRRGANRPSLRTSRCPTRCLPRSRNQRVRR